MITHLEGQTSKLEDKPEIMHSNTVMVQGHTEKLHSLDSDSNKHHFTIIELVDEYQETLAQEQALLDDHEDKTTNMLDHVI